MLKRIDTPRWREALADKYDIADELDPEDIIGILAIEDGDSDDFLRLGTPAAVFLLDCEFYPWMVYPAHFNGMPYAKFYKDLDRLIDENDGLCRALGLRDTKRHKKGRYDNAQCVDDYSYGGIFDAHPAT